MSHGEGTGRVRSVRTSPLRRIETSAGAPGEPRRRISGCRGIGAVDEKDEVPGLQPGRLGAAADFQDPETFSLPLNQDVRAARERDLPRDDEGQRHHARDEDQSEEPGQEVGQIS